MVWTWTNFFSFVAVYTNNCHLNYCSVSIYNVFKNTGFEESFNSSLCMAIGRVCNINVIVGQDFVLHR